MDNLKLVYVSDKIIIKNYHELKDVNSNFIEIDYLIIEGSFLKISRKEIDEIEVYGKIKAIKFII